MNLGGLEKDYTSITSNYSQSDQVFYFVLLYITIFRLFPLITSQNKINKSIHFILSDIFFNFYSQGNIDLSKGFQPSFDRSSLKNLSNEELDRLIQMKNQNIEKFQATTHFNPAQKESSGSSLTSSGHKISNSNVSQILNKYNLSGSEGERGTFEKKNDTKVSEANFMSNLDTVPVTTTHQLPSLNPTFTTTGFDSLKRNLEQAAKERNKNVEPLKENSFHMNALDNPYLSNLEQSVDRADFQQRSNPKENDSLSFNQDYVLGKENQMSTSVLENSPLRSSGARQQNKENILKNLSRLQVTPKGLPKPLRNDGGSPGKKDVFSM